MAELHKPVDKGFTLVELLVVITILGTLAGIALPMFMTHTKKAIDTSLKADLHTLVEAQETYYVDHMDYATDQASLEEDSMVLEVSEQDTVITVYVPTDGPDRFCAVGYNPGGEAASEEISETYTYSSDSGGLRAPGKAAGVCLEDLSGADSFEVIYTDFE